MTHIKFPRRKNTANVQAALNLAEQKQDIKEKFGLCDPSFEYKPAVKTDVRKTWMKFGWKPVHEHDIEGEQK